MRTVYSPAHAAHRPPREFLDGALIPSFESPERAELIRAAVAGLGPITAPNDHGMAPIEAIHDRGYLSYLRDAHAAWVAAGRSPEGVYPDTFLHRHALRRPSPPRAVGAQSGHYTSDLSAVITAGTWEAAYAAAQCALTAALGVAAGEGASFALCRPPGHHAYADLCGGYCYLNNAAIAAQALRRAGAHRVAVLDIDFHHGNGTQHLFYAREDVLFVSLHADPDRQYPYFAGFADETGAGTGLGFTLNLPLPAGCDDAGYLAALDTGCARVARARPDFVLVSLGVDTFGGDPLGDFALSGGVYARIGAHLAELGAPTVFIMEGGYAIAEIGDNVASVLRGFETRRAQNTNKEQSQACHRQI
ncbi:MAG: histone deacetylase family protein [Thermoflexales bacterium]|nr:histone deacetylase family protein [Thermoflexales bacterium]